MKFEFVYLTIIYFIRTLVYIKKTLFSIDCTCVRRYIYSQLSCHVRILSYFIVIVTRIIRKTNFFYPWS